MAVINAQKVTLTGLAPTFTAAAAGGDTLPPLGRGIFIVKNGGAAAITVTIATPGNTQFGIAQPDITVSVPAGGERHIGPLLTSLTDPTSERINVTYSAVTSVTVAVVTD